MRLSTMISNNDEYNVPENEVENTEQESSEESVENSLNYENYTTAEIQEIAGVTNDVEIASNDTIIPEPPSEAEQAELDYMKSLTI